MGGQYGTQETNDAVLLLAYFGNGYGKSLEDGKFSFSNDLLNFAPVLPQIIPAFSGASQIPKELAELDAEDNASIQQTLEDAFDIPQDRVEDFVEDTVSLALTGTRKLSLYSYAVKWFVGPNRISRK